MLQAEVGSTRPPIFYMRHSISMKRRRHTLAEAAMHSGDSARQTTCGAAVLIKVFAHRSKHRAKHVRRQHAGVGVVARAVIAREQRERPDLGPAAMAERRRRAFRAQR